MDSLTIPENIVADLAQCRRGIEREGLRVGHDGVLSEKTHPQLLGSALTHPSITTDYSEALLEFVTAPHNTVDEAIKELNDIHRFTAHVLEQQNEMIWANSMPCLMIEDNEIPIAKYGCSNIGQMKTVYRRGLGHRYGRTMQTIAGIHYNWSLSDTFWQRMADNAGQNVRYFKSTQLMKTVRNIYRSSGIITYLLGASPAVCPTFLRGGDAKGLKELSGGTLYSEFGTSLRLSDIGYSNNNEQRAKVRFDTIEHYAADLLTATRTPNKNYEKFGLKVDGEYQQLSFNILQLENEYYAPVRPKQIARGLVRVADALLEEGIGYLELRIVDNDPYSEIGISASTCYLLEAYLLACLLRDEPDDDPLGENYTAMNRAIVENGRDQNAHVRIDGVNQQVSDWLRNETDHIQNAAQLLDQANGSDNYSNAVRSFIKGIDDPHLLPSARVMNDVEQHGSFFRFAMAQSEQHQKTLIESPLTSDELAHYHQIATQSLLQQQKLEEQSEVSFDQYLIEYFN